MPDRHYGARPTAPPCLALIAAPAVLWTVAALACWRVLRGA